MPSDDERDDEITGHDLLANSSLFQGAAEELVGAGARVMGVSSDDKRQDLRDEVGEMMPEGTAGQRGDLIDAAVAGGLALGSSRADIRETFGARAAAREADDADVDVGGPLVQAREIEHADGSFGGVRVFVDLPPEEVDVFRGDRSLLIRTPAGDHEEMVGFQPGSIEWEDNDDANAVAEFVVRASATDAGDQDLEADAADAPADEDGGGEDHGDDHDQEDGDTAAGG